MNTRFRLGISVLLVALSAPLAAHAQGAVTVLGGGLARVCYEAAESGHTALQQALDACDRAILMEPLKRRDKAATFTNRGILLMRMGNNTRAMWDYQRSLELMPELKEAKVNLGAALYNLRRYPEALAALTEGLSAMSIDARVAGYYNRGLTNEKLGNLQAAYEDYRAALDMQPDFKMAADQIDRFTVVPATAS